MSTNLKAARDTYVATLRRIVTEKETTAQAAITEFEKAKAELAAVTGSDTTATVRKAAAKPGPKPGRKASRKTATKVERQKPGPKPKKAKKTATPKKTTAKKPGPKPKKAKKTATPKKTATSSATQGRRAVAQGLRPPLKEALAILIGSKTLDIGAAISALHAKGWMPECENERSYISYALSSNKDIFERVSRGAYKVRSGVAIKWNGSSKDETKPTTKPTTKTDTKATKKVSTSDEQKLQDLGVGVTSNPFMS